LKNKINKTGKKYINPLSLVKLDKTIINQNNQAYLLLFKSSDLNQKYQPQTTHTNKGKSSSIFLDISPITGNKENNIPENKATTSFLLISLAKK
jgi:hypothetical protein